MITTVMQGIQYSVLKMHFCREINYLINQSVGTYGGAVG
jgi:hypothetical protein